MSHQSSTSLSIGTLRTKTYHKASRQAVASFVYLVQRAADPLQCSARNLPNAGKRGQAPGTRIRNRLGCRSPLFDAADADESGGRIADVVMESRIARSTCAQRDALMHTMNREERRAGLHMGVARCLATQTTRVQMLQLRVSLASILIERSQILMLIKQNSR